MRRFSLFVSLFAASVLAGCGGNGYATPNGPTTYVPPATGGPFVYVTDGGNFVLQLPQSQNGAVSPASTIGGPATGLFGADGIVRDSAGNIYVADARQNAISVFAPNLAGNASPKLQIAGSSTGLAGPRGLALDAQGR